MNSFVRRISSVTRTVIKKRTKNYYRRYYSKKYHGGEYTLLSSNCIGGIINNRVGQPQNSPTFNLWISQSEFITFVLDLRHYLQQDLRFIDTTFNYPVAMLDDIHIYFSHYQSCKQAKEEWDKRKKRIIWDNIYIILYEDKVTREELLQLSRVECKKLIVLTEHKDNLDLPFMYYIERDKHGREDNNVFLDTDFLGRRTFEKQWDFVEWLNK